MPSPNAVDPQDVKAFSFNVWSYKQGEMVSLMIHLGDKLGIYRALTGAGPVTAAELAERTELKERWLLEWLRGQAAAQLLTYHGENDAGQDRFELSAAGAEVLSNETDSLAFAAGAFSAPIGSEVAEKLADAFRTGIGLSYQDLGANAAHRTERMLGPWIRQALVPRIIPALDGVEQKLRSGATVADVGCGSGAALLAMAEAFPKSEFHGYDPSAHATSRAEAKAKELGLSNVVLHTAGGEDLPKEPKFDFLLTFDCLHDMTHPAEVMASIRKAIRPDGTWLIKDIRCESRFEDNFRNPMLAMFYGFSVSACMSSALSTPDGAGLGTLGFSPDVAEKMTREAGFPKFQMHDFEDPTNLYYEVRP